MKWPLHPSERRYGRGMLFPYGYAFEDPKCAQDAPDEDDAPAGPPPDDPPVREPELSCGPYSDEHGEVF